jgi:hypothetical protein
MCHTMCKLQVCVADAALQPRLSQRGLGFTALVLHACHLPDMWGIRDTLEMMPSKRNLRDGMGGHDIQVSHEYT